MSTYESFEAEARREEILRLDKDLELLFRERLGDVAIRQTDDLRTPAELVLAGKAGNAVIDMRQRLTGDKTYEYLLSSYQNSGTNAVEIAANEAVSIWFGLPPATLRVVENIHGLLSTNSISWDRKLSECYANSLSTFDFKWIYYRPKT